MSSSHNKTIKLNYLGANRVLNEENNTVVEMLKDVEIYQTVNTNE